MTTNKQDKFIQQRMADCDTAIAASGEASLVSETTLMTDHNVSIAASREASLVVGEDLVRSSG
jgi:hypothetical protein